MRPASVSVVIPTFNSGRLVTQAIESVLAQTLGPAEIIVVDDGSEDDTRQRLLPFEGRIRYLAQDNRGVAAARNLGVNYAAGELIAFLDADDVWHPRKLELQLETFSSRPELGLLGAGTFPWPAESIPDVEGTPRACEGVSWRRLVVKNYFTTSSVLVRSDLLKQAGLFDPELRGPEDHDLWLRVAELAEVANLPVPLTGYRRALGGLGSQPRAMQAGMRRILQKLDARRVWRGRWLLRRKAYSYVDYSSAYLQRTAGCRGRALGHLLRSLAWYPLPYRRTEVRMALARPKSLARIVGELLIRRSKA